jgi:glycine/D-amino acid oxidase-like deaminating enzyme
MRRRDLLLAGASAAFLASRPLDRLARHRLPVTIYRPGMAEGHWLRDHPQLPAASEQRQVETVIIGSGIGGLTTAWKLKREGYNNFLLLSGPEFGGNAASGHNGDLQFPLGAHYLPVPTQESVHVREMLADFGILQGPAGAERPRYDESLIVHALQERLLINGHWQEGFVPAAGTDQAEHAQQARFFAFVQGLKNRRGRDGRKLFAIPVALSSTDEEWRSLDQQTFAGWLKAQGYMAPGLRWYLDYCCRDDYGVTSNKISAWAGLHYFASRTGLASNAEEDALLTWPGGLDTMAQRLFAPVRQHGLAGFAIGVRPADRSWNVYYAESAKAGARTVCIRARHVVFATPLHAPWMVANFVLKDFPVEQDYRDCPLAWDNVVYDSPAMGYVVSTHQLIRVARPERTVFTAYQALSAWAPTEARQWMLKASQDEMVDEVATDLLKVYGPDIWRHTSSLHITQRGHAMASPAPGFLDNAGLAALRQGGQGLHFAHADISSLSIFEEASWWGWQAAGNILST